MAKRSNIIVIHARKMCQYLLARGFVLVGVENSLNSRNKVFFFVDSPAIRKAMSEFQADVEFHKFLDEIAARR